MMSDLSISRRKISDFVSVPLFALTFVMKLKDFGFKSHLNTLLFFDQKKGFQIRVCSMEECLILFHFPSTRLLLS